MIVYVRRRAKGEMAYSTEAPEPPRPSRRELQEAYAWWCLGLLEDGTASDQADLARQLGVSRARITQVLRGLEPTPRPK